MALSKVKTAVVLGVAVLLAAGTATLKINAVHQRALNAWETTNFNFPEILSKVPPQVRILPTKYPGFFRAESDGEIGKLTGHIGIGAHLGTLVQSAFEVLHQDRIIYPTNAPDGPYDYFANLRQGSSAALQQEMKKTLGLSAKLETVDTDVLLLKVKTLNAPGLKPTKGKSRWTEVRLAEIVDTNMLMSAFATQLEDYIFNLPVLDQTGLTTGFDMDVRLPPNSTYMDTKAVKQALLDQLGLELVPSREPVEMLVIRKMK